MNFKFLTSNRPDRRERREYCKKFIKSLYYNNEIDTTIYPKKYNYKNLEITVDFINYTTDPTFGYPIFFSGTFFRNKENHEIHYSFLHPERALNVI